MVITSRDVSFIDQKIHTTDDKSPQNDISPQQHTRNKKAVNTGIPRWMAPTNRCQFSFHNTPVVSIHW